MHESKAERCSFLPRNVVLCRAVLSRLADFSRTSSPRVSFSTGASCEFTSAYQVTSEAEVSGYLVGSPAFKAGGRGAPTTAGSIPVHLRQRQCE